MGSPWCLAWNPGAPEGFHWLSIPEAKLGRPNRSRAWSHHPDSLTFSLSKKNFSFPPDPCQATCKRQEGNLRVKPGAPMRLTAGHQAASQWGPVPTF